LTVEQGIRAYEQLDAIPVQIVEELGLRRRSREIAERFNQRLVYDSLYAALADLRQCELWTADTRFHRVVKADLMFVRHSSEYVG
jgi:predicted nucleic acid-binding protein